MAKKNSNGVAPEVGPIVGECSGGAVRIVVAGRQVDCQKYEGIAAVYLMHVCVSSKTFRLHADFDRTGLVVFTGLTRTMQYHYRAGVRKKGSKNSVQQDLMSLPLYSFTVHAADTTIPCNINLFSNRFVGEQGLFLRQSERGVKTLIDHKTSADINIFCGGTVHEDPDLPLTRVYRQVLTSPAIRNILANVPSLMSPGQTDLDISDFRKQYLSHRAYQSYQALHAPLMELNDKGVPVDFPTHWYYQYCVGCCSFFVTDTITERLPNTIMSLEQQQAIVSFLTSTEDKGVRCIVMSQPFMGDGGLAKVYHRQQNAIMDAMAKSPHPVVLLCGSTNGSRVDSYQLNNTNKMIHQVCVGSMFKPFNEQTQRMPDIVGRVSVMPSNYHNTVTRCSVSPEELTIELFGRKGGDPQTVTINL